MSFLNINQKEFYLILVLVIERVKRGNLAPERRSGIAAKDQHNWLLTSRRGEFYGCALVLPL
jgi:hypothetical protein